MPPSAPGTKPARKWMRRPSQRRKQFGYRRGISLMISSFFPRSYHFTSPQPAPLFRQHDGIGRVPGVVFHGNRVDRREIGRYLLLQHRDILRRGVLHSANAVGVEEQIVDRKSTRLN